MLPTPDTGFLKMAYLNDVSKLTTLTTVITSEWSIEANLTLDQNIVLNAVLHCIGGLSGEMTNAARMINWLASYNIQGVEGDTLTTSINVPLGLDKHTNEVLHIRLGRKTNGGRWFIYTTCIGALGLPVTVGNKIQTRNDIFSIEWLDS
jgi:hypothetical protein|tara:strand:- start:1064 stop:1510 length:447 start_codon:yes stop_codon:yes gene_type:complete